MQHDMSQFLGWVRRGFTAVLLSCFVFMTNSSLQAQKKKKTSSRSTPKVSEVDRLRDEFIKATKDYKASLEKLVEIYERNVKRSEEQLTQAKDLFSQGLISKTQLTESENAVTVATTKVTETRRQMEAADTQIADTLLEAKAEAQMAKTRLRRGALLSTTAYIRYNGPANWSLADSWKVQQFFQNTFKKPLPIAVFGQGAIHDRWRLDHHNSMDISLHPDGPEGQALINFLRSNGIPFLAFRTAIPGTATGPHIHVGRPSHRF